MFLNDQETATDHLYDEAIARTVVKLIRQTPGVPLPSACIAIGVRASPAS